MTTTDRGASAPAPARDLTYVVADIHGRFDCLTLALDRIRDHAAAERSGERQVVFTGDYVDRGPQSREVIELLMAGPPEGWDWTCLKGNHEDMMWAALSGEDYPDHWIANGGGATIVSFGGASGVTKAHLDWIGELSPLCVDQHRVYVHAGVDPTIPLDRQSMSTLLWSRSDCAMGHDERHVIHGHTPFAGGPRVTPGRTNLDTMAFRTGRLVVAVFDDAIPGPPIEFLECQA